MTLKGVVMKFGCRLKRKSAAVLFEADQDCQNRATPTKGEESRKYALVGDPTLGDAILDRLVHNAHRLQLTGESMRKQNARNQTLDAVPNA